MNKRITALIQELKQELESMPIDEKVSALNDIKHQLKVCSPFEEPVDCVHWVPSHQVHGNEYNPNKVASPEMKLLHQSIKLDGYTQPIVCYRKEESYYEVVDGFHRNRIGKEYADIHKRIHGYLPVVVIDKPMDERMGSTIRHNRARGTHQIRSMSDIIIELSREGWKEEEICAKLGMELDEVIRLKQISGLKEAFQNHDFSKSWDEFESRYYSEG
ncbi:IbrB-like domain-containing protein [Paenibacillus larvae]|uniref:ParB-like nuclease domain protein n=1 Tax=Paenibacillus larvae subsp. larvae TaxID=147375 RepID=A0A2L1U7G8_9BACL|nr:ParB/RepB/Spo0J family partition protein [Paenibacillus larvae]AVF28870.1 ParB-like nuclease domain protein [Paenibacillus larvae subsp. larvae]MCY9502431.1 ParB/RepB/Spo0J family partition protein [Paenibacillus larvae]MCY9746369.1 ParB/RepB/Spo0J family partition protein [Paenibacillus larvae]MCY9752089.1 ParB/RepB/Spo0J family partition protein [Paenibacillus larvae]MDR5608765.1 ParB/RepB/Spo0J family partition protein [Paenibacillus larvae]